MANKMITAVINVKNDHGGVRVHDPPGGPGPTTFISRRSAIIRLCLRAAACRVCLVEAERNPKLLTSCTTPLTEGMVVVHQQPQSPGGAQGRRRDACLSGNPLDCFSCESNGRCELQNLAYELGIEKIPLHRRGRRPCTHFELDNTNPFFIRGHEQVHSLRPLRPRLRLASRVPRHRLPVQGNPHADQPAHRDEAGGRSLPTASSAGSASQVCPGRGRSSRRSRLDRGGRGRRMSSARRARTAASAASSTCT